MNPQRWDQLCVLLSLDVILPFHESMGLFLSDHELFVTLLRPHLNVKHIQQESSLDDEAIFVPAQPVLDDISKTLGEADAASLYGWALRQFTAAPVDHPHWSAWEMLFSFCAYSPKKRQRLDLPTALRDPLFDSFEASTDRGDIEKQIEAIKQNPLSDWDLETYARYAFYADEMAEPFPLVLSTTRMYRFQFFWSHVLERLSLEDLDRLHRSGQAYLEEHPIWMPEPLRHPSDLWRPGA